MGSDLRIAKGGSEDQLTDYKSHLLPFQSKSGSNVPWYGQMFSLSLSPSLFILSPSSNVKRTTFLFLNFSFNLLHAFERYQRTFRHCLPAFLALATNAKW